MVAKPNGFGTTEQNELDLSEPDRLIGLLMDEGLQLLNVTVGNPYYNPHVNRPYRKGGYEAPEAATVGLARFETIEKHIKERFQEPNAEHWLGTDQYGRDVLTRILYGAKYSLSVGIVSMAIACGVGSTLGLIAGYYGGWIENIILRTCEVFVGIPTILLGVAIMTAFGQSLGVLMWAIGLVYVPLFARTARAAVLPVRNEEYIEAARMAGVSDMGIIFKHILPNSLSPIIVRTTMGVASGVLSASSLSFLGMGVPVPAPEWGAMLSNGREFIRDHSYLTLFPGLAIMIVVLALNLIGDGVRDALDPKLRR